jgi:hypothetical protein
VITGTPGDAPGQALEWAVQLAAKAGTIGIIGVYPPTMTAFPVGEALNKNLTVNMGKCNHRRYLPELIDVVASGRVSLRWRRSSDGARLVGRTVAQLAYVGSSLRRQADADHAVGVEQSTGVLSGNCHVGNHFLEPLCLTL